MSYITVEEYMTFAGITSIDSTTSARITVILDTTTDIINSNIGDVSLSQKTEKIKISDVLGSCDIVGANVIELSNIEIQSLDEINGKSYTGVLNKDYQIIPPLKSRIAIFDFAKYIEGIDFDWLEIKYTSGFEEIPNDIKYLQYLLTSGELAKQDGQEVKSYSLGPRSVSFKDTPSFDTAKSIISKYSLFRL